jgi:hypothetical protein
VTLIESINLNGLLLQLPAIVSGGDTCNRYNGGMILLSLFVWIYWGIDTAEEKPVSRKSFLLLLVFPLFLIGINIFTLLDPLCGELQPFAAFGIIASPVLGAASFFISRAIRQKRAARNTNHELPSDKKD